MKYTKKMRDYDDEEQAERELKKRRPIRNWTKMYSEHADDIDEYDDFHNHRLKS
jgi:hypothetical protein